MRNLTPAEFKHHYETSHVPLIQSLAGPLFPKSHTRFYIERKPQSQEPSPTPASSAPAAAPTVKSTPEAGRAAPTGTASEHWPATVFVGGQSDFSYDAYAELVFEDVDAFQAFFGVVSAPEAAARIAEDEDLFLERSELRIAAMDDVRVTLRED